MNQDYSIEQSWSGIMGFRSKAEPALGSVSKHIFHAVSLGGMGLALGTLIGQEAIDTIYTDTL